MQVSSGIIAAIAAAAAEQGVKLLARALEGDGDAEAKLATFLPATSLITLERAKREAEAERVLGELK